MGLIIFGGGARSVFAAGNRLVMKPQMTSDRAIEALLMVVWRCKPKQEVMIHSDHGSQFSSGD